MFAPATAGDVPAAANPMTRILIADDAPVDAALLQAVCVAEGYEVTVVGDGAAAVAAFERTGADLVLLDASMPVVDGFTAATRIRAALGRRWIPIVLVSAGDDSTSVVRGLEAGADDFLGKPFDPNVLRAKLRVLARASQEQETVERFRAWKAHESAMASAVLEHIVEPFRDADPAVRQRTRAATEFSGDLVLARRADEDTSYVLVADAVGHGLAATICVLPLVRVFATMTARKLPLTTIVEEMNQQLRDMLPTGYYVAACVLTIDHARARVAAWNGGLPPALLVTQGTIVAELPSRHPPLGVLAADDLDTAVDALQASPGNHLLLYSDGLNEACNAAGETFGNDRLRAALGAASSSAELDAELDAVLAALRAFTGDIAPHDDVTVVAAAIG